MGVYNGGMSKNLSIPLSIIVGAGLIAGGVYFGLKEGLKKDQFDLQPSPEASVIPSAKPTPIPTPTSTPTPVPEISWTKSELRKALSRKSGIPESELKFSVGDEIKKPGKILLRGSLGREGEMGGAGFFAVVNDQGIKVTYVGQGVPECSEVNPYGYPTSWADYCLDSSGQTVKR